jgi:hypothetical protein
MDSPELAVLAGFFAGGLFIFGLGCYVAVWRHQMAGIVGLMIGGTSMAFLIYRVQTRVPLDGPSGTRQQGARGVPPKRMWAKGRLAMNKRTWRWTVRAFWVAAAFEVALRINGSSSPARLVLLAIVGAGVYLIRPS